MEFEDPLVTEYRKTFPQKFQNLRDHLNALIKERSLQALSVFRQDVHKIAGSSGTYGFMTASNLCKNLDSDLQEKIKNFNKEIFSSDWFSYLEGFLKELEKALENPDIKIKF